MVRALRGQRPRGVILASSRASGEDAELEGELDALEKLGGGVAAFGGQREPRILIDNFGGARAIGARMAGLGYRRAIALVAAGGVRLRRSPVGVRRGLRRDGGAVERGYRGDFGRETGAALMEQAVSNRVSAGTLVFGMSDVIAIGAMTAARDAGLAVGRDLAFCGFDDIPGAHDVSPGLTTVHVPLEEIGYEAFRLVARNEAPAPRTAGGRTRQYTESGVMRVLLATDGFKGTISAADAVAALAAGWAEAAPGAELTRLPMADGGEGTLDAFAAAVGEAKRMPVTVTGPMDEPVDANWLLVPAGPGAQVAARLSRSPRPPASNCSTLRARWMRTPSDSGRRSPLRWTPGCRDRSSASGRAHPPTAAAGCCGRWGWTSSTGPASGSRSVRGGARASPAST